MSEQTLSIVLPFPPSANTLYATVNGRRVLSKKGRLYKREVGYLVMPLKSRLNLPMEGRIRVKIQYFAKTKRRYDLMNFNKAILDAFTESGVYFDDSQIDEIFQKRGLVKNPSMVEVQIFEI